MNGTIETVTAATFDALVLGTGDPTVVEFMSYGCSHCRALEPVLEQVAATLSSRERVLRVNVAVELELADRYEVRVTPTLVMFRDGHELERVEGPRPNASSLLASVTRPFAEFAG